MNLHQIGCISVARRGHLLNVTRRHRYLDQKMFDNHAMLHFIASEHNQEVKLEGVQQHDQIYTYYRDS